MITRTGRGRRIGAMPESRSSRACSNIGNGDGGLSPKLVVRDLGDQYLVFIDDSSKPLAHVVVASWVADLPKHAGVQNELHLVVSESVAECSWSLLISVGSQSGSSTTGSVFHRASISFTRRARSARSAAAIASRSGVGLCESWRVAAALRAPPVRLARRGRLVALLRWCPAANP